MGDLVIGTVKVISEVKNEDTYKYRIYLLQQVARNCWDAEYKKNSSDKVVRASAQLYKDEEAANYEFDRLGMEDFGAKPIFVAVQKDSTAYVITERLFQVITPTRLLRVVKGVSYVNPDLWVSRGNFKGFTDFYRVRFQELLFGLMDVHMNDRVHGNLRNGVLFGHDGKFRFYGFNPSIPTPTPLSLASAKHADFDQFISFMSDIILTDNPQATEATWPPAEKSFYDMVKTPIMQHEYLYWLYSPTCLWPCTVKAAYLEEMNKVIKQNQTIAKIVFVTMPMNWSDRITQNHPVFWRVLENPPTNTSAAPVQMNPHAPGQQIQGQSTRYHNYSFSSGSVEFGRNFLHHAVQMFLVNRREKKRSWMFAEGVKILEEELPELVSTTYEDMVRNGLFNHYIGLSFIATKQAGVFTTTTLDVCLRGLPSIFRQVEVLPD